MYCSTPECQRADWPKHKTVCQTEKGSKWYDRHRFCRDGSKHHGKLELITWPSRKEETGWGHCFEDESADLKKKYEQEYGSNDAKFFKHWPQGYRWTCCGTDGGMSWGCDHHGTGPSPCTCDFCKMGRPLPDSIYNDGSASRMGLNLSRGPDPRSGNRLAGAFAAMGREMFGMET
ncbi:hypothetical protein BDZ89DRAFT_1061535 [Hymenopellis radicata]|nr:hypothetical protein BDZ89DRAFT_1061535 [Hymenopellis radicata]